MNNVWCENAHCSAYGLIICSMARRSLNVALPTLYTAVYVPIDSVSPFVTAAIWCFVVHSRYHAFPAKEFNTCLQVFR